MDIKIVGMDKVINILDKMNDLSSVEAAMGKACAIVEATAKRKAPKETGALRRSIESKVESEGVNNVKGIIFTPLEYAPYVEYGTGLNAEGAGRSNVPWVYVDEKGKGHTTSGQHPQPFMRPAVNENRSKIKQILMEGIKND